MSNVERCVTPTSLTLETLEPESTQTQTTFSICGTQFRPSKSLMENLDLIECLVASQPPREDEEEAPPSPVYISTQQVADIGAFIEADECFRAAQPVDISPLSEIGAPSVPLHSQPETPEASKATEDLQPEEEEEVKRPRRTRSKRMAVQENDENAEPGDERDENWAPKRPKRQTRAQSMTAKSEPRLTRAVKRKGSAPLGDITNVKAQKQDELEPVQLVEEVEVCRRSQEPEITLLDTPSTLIAPSSLPSPILSLVETPSDKQPAQDLDSSIISINAPKAYSQEVVEAAGILFDMSTKPAVCFSKPQLWTNRKRTPIVYANNDQELLHYGVGLRMYCYDDTDGTGDQFFTDTRPPPPLLQTFTTNSAAEYSALGEASFITNTPIGLNIMESSFLAENNLWLRTFAPSQSPEDDLGLNIVREMAKVQTPPRRQSEPSEAADENSEGELEESSLHSTFVDEDEDRSVLITADEIERELRATSELLDKEENNLKLEEECNKVRYALGKFNEFFTPDELRNGILADPRGKSRSKTRTALDPERVEKVKQALAEKFELDDSYLDILWANMRGELNKRLKTAPKKSRKPSTPKKTTLKVKLFNIKK